jgi:hypothetical protein
MTKYFPIYDQMHDALGSTPHTEKKKKKKKKKRKEKEEEKEEEEKEKEEENRTTVRCFGAHSWHMEAGESQVPGQDALLKRPCHTPQNVSQQEAELH